MLSNLNNQFYHKMKAIHYITLIALVMLLSSCGKDISTDTEEDMVGHGYAFPRISYWVCMSFVDGEGNDLATPLISAGDDRNPLHANPEKYNLDILLSDGSKQDVENVEYFQIYNHFGNDGRYYLFNDFFMYSADLQNQLTYKITCPTVFGDNSVHEIVTCWIDDPAVAYKKDPGHVYDSEGHRIMQQTPQCTSATFDGKEILVKKIVFTQDMKGKEYYSYFLDIVLDR